MLEERELSYRVRGCVYEVYKTLGNGFLEKIYENALLKELALQGLSAQAQVPVKVRYKDEVVGEYLADIIVENHIILELKAQSQLLKAHEAQLLNYLKASDLKVGMLVNFSHPKASIRRFVI